jgi:hypothetical protein
MRIALIVVSVVGDVNVEKRRAPCVKKNLIFAARVEKPRSIQYSFRIAVSG